MHAGGKLKTTDLTAKPVHPIQTVLIVDDDATVLRAMNLLLARAGYSAVVAQSGAEALAKTSHQIVAAILDIHLPDMNGLELSQLLRDRIGPDIPIFILSGDNSMEIIRALPEAGATYFFSKPVNSEILIERLREGTAHSSLHKPRH